MQTEVDEDDVCKYCGYYATYAHVDNSSYNPNNVYIYYPTGLKILGIRDGTKLISSHASVKNSASAQNAFPEIKRKSGGLEEREVHLSEMQLEAIENNGSEGSGSSSN